MNAQLALLLSENHFIDEKHQKDLITVIFLMHHNACWYGLLII